MKSFRLIKIVTKIVVSLMVFWSSLVFLVYPSNFRSTPACSTSSSFVRRIASEGFLKPHLNIGHTGHFKLMTGDYSLAPTNLGIIKRVVHGLSPGVSPTLVDLHAIYHSQFSLDHNPCKSPLEMI
ncbi:hypothetical protein BDR07DRAFT_194150 [Suillus spraguei]|nr:hypothetical protein BDR07DRAFT_194150 [Suillus spraguei]